MFLHSGERRSNENSNGLIRQYFPKNTDFKIVNDEDVYDVMQKLTNSPREFLGLKTPTQMMQRSFAKSGISWVALQS